ncbi:ABC transporter substrate-binding protein [Paenibacillus nasutitermitis]|uniref:ABC transporter substrate-binding protein n=1 Tax=Paenibacillus nasutitermitis TaxID=1652958 RepID=A0A917DMB2_9BACL|nr:extracellular solute-binding protein [Paenibacillus nasutitermitis]GGD50032.1 ABC transporter substrate-binding protein [Paenibacillus nasutitermitis]
MRKTLMILIASMLAATTVLIGCEDASERRSITEPQEVVKLSVSGYKAGSEIGAIPELNDLFMKENPGIEVIYEGMLGIQYAKFIQNKFAANDAPDVIMLHPGEEHWGYAKIGFVRDLSEEPWVTRFTPTALEAVSLDGKVYGTPNDTVVLGVFYNKDLFKKLSLKTPTTWSEFLAVCARLKEAGVTPISIGNYDGWMTLVALFAMGSSLIHDPDFTQKINAREIKFNGTWNDMAKMWFALDDIGYLTPNSTNVTIDQAQKDFTDGRAGMFINGSWALDGLLKANPDYRIGMFAMPAASTEEDTVLTVAAGTTWAISSNTKQLDAARKYLDFWAREQTLRRWTQTQGAFLTLKDKVSYVPAELSEIYGFIEEGRIHEYLSNRWDQSGPAVDELMDSAQGVYLDALTIEEMLTNVDDAWDRSASNGGGFR